MITRRQFLSAIASVAALPKIMPDPANVIHDCGSWPEGHGSTEYDMMQPMRMFVMSHVKRNGEREQWQLNCDDLMKRLRQ